jgi:hypothetical protein
MRAHPPEAPAPFVADAAHVEPTPDEARSPAVAAPWWGSLDDGRSVAAAAPWCPVDDRPDRRPRGPDARWALAWAVLGVVCLGFVIGPLACAMGERARLALVDDPSIGGAREAGAAIALGRLALVVHLTITAAALPFLVFVIGL